MVEVKIYGESAGVRALRIKLSAVLGETSNWQTWATQRFMPLQEIRALWRICDSQIFFLFNKKSRLIHDRHFIQTWWQGPIVIAATPLEAKFRANLSNFKRLSQNKTCKWSGCSSLVEPLPHIYEEDPGSNPGSQKRAGVGWSCLPPPEDSLVLYCLYCSSPPSCGRRGQVRSLCLPFLWVCYCSSDVTGRRQERRLCVKLLFNV